MVWFGDVGVKIGFATPNPTICILSLLIFPPIGIIIPANPEARIYVQLPKSSRSQLEDVSGFMGCQHLPKIMEY